MVRLGQTALEWTEWAVVLFFSIHRGRRSAVEARTSCCVTANVLLGLYIALVFRISLNDTAMEAYHIYVTPCYIATSVSSIMS